MVWILEIEQWTGVSLIDGISTTRVPTESSKATGTPCFLAIPALGFRQAVQVPSPSVPGAAAGLRGAARE